MRKLSALDRYYKKKKSDKVFWLKNEDKFGVWEFTFDGVYAYNLFADYPHNLKPEEKEIFDRENPYWRDFFKGRN